MNTFEITVERKAGDGWPVVVEQRGPASALELRTEGTLALAASYEADLRAVALDPKGYGTLLGQALFRDEVLRAFDRAGAAGDGPLRVLLFVEAVELRPVRWERLCAPFDGGWDFLALDQDTPFSLYLPSVADRRFPPIGRRDLRALVVAASPAGLDQFRLEPFDVGAAIAGVRASLGEIPSDCLVTADPTPALEGVVGPATLDELAERLTAGGYTLLHLVAHGAVVDGETVVYLARADGAVGPVPAAALVERLQRLQAKSGLPRLAFLSACESASAEVEGVGGLGSLAQRLVRDLGMPAVVAMTDKVSVATAQDLATVFYRRLREHGEPDSALVEATAGLAGRADVTVPALYSRLGGRPLFSDADRALTDLTAAETGDGLDRLDALLAVRAPALRSGADYQKDVASLRGALGADPAQLSEAARAERKRALEAVDAVSREAVDVSFDGLALGKEPPVYDDRCPFRGLAPFRAEDRPFFFGREALIEALAGKLADHPFLPVLGPSGSGKSSVVLAGLVPALQAREPGLGLAYFTPGSDPPAALAAALAAVGEGPAVLVADQFEEAFTLCHDEARRVAFFAGVLAEAERRRVVLTMRADFWGECAPYPALRAAMQARQELIAPMDAAELRRAMELQAAAVGLRFEADLAAAILDDVRGEPGAMPLLQFALLELWNRRHGRWLRAVEYRALGQVQGAIAQAAEAIYRDLGEADQERVRDIFVRLTRLDEEGAPGAERRDTRRRVGLDELVPAGGDAAAVKALVARLASAGLLVTGRATPAAASTADGAAP